MRRLYTERMVRELLRQDLRRFSDVKEMADDLRVSRSYLSETLRGKKPPRGRILHSLGLKNITVYAVSGATQKRGADFVFD